MPTLIPWTPTQPRRAAKLVSASALERENKRLAREQKRTGHVPPMCHICPLFIATRNECQAWAVLREPCRTGEIERAKRR